jgi:hypothetical protein
MAPTKEEPLFLKRIITLTALLICLSRERAMAWGRQGHEIVATLAQGRLTPLAEKIIDSLRLKKLDLVSLHPNERLAAFKYIDTNLSRFCDKREPLDLSLIANWADGWREREPSTAAWHFINLPIGSPVAANDEAAYCKDNNCVVDQIALQLAILKDITRRPEDRLKALFFVVHLVGDIHQPLHCADDHDRGGNSKQAKFFGKKTSLHHIWDDSIINVQHQNVAQMVGDAEQGYSEADAKAWQATTPSDWALESHAIAEDEIYKGYPRDGSIPNYGQDYEDRMASIVKKQLTRAGVRLAGLLNQLGDQER